MDAKSREDLREAIRKLHGCDSRWVESTQVAEPFFKGEVQVFQLVGHPTAERCYAWSQPVGRMPEGTGRNMTVGREQRVHVVLHGATVDSAPKAVKATIAARERTQLF
jgi:hypothetical protein